MQGTLLERTPDEMEAWCEASGFPRYHGRQVLHWIHKRDAGSFDEMTDLPQRLREALAVSSAILTSEVVGNESSLDGTRKLLVRLADGKSVECVLIPDRGRHTACISTQVGCAVGCVFCASGLDGVERNLTAAEIVEQVVHLRRTLRSDRRITNLVFMGMGEPLHNFDNLVRSIDVLKAPWGTGLGARRITVSTSGPPGRIRRLVETGIPVHLAVSLHAPDDRLRARLVPGQTAPVADLLADARAFFEATGRRVTMEVALIDRLNDGPAVARAMADRLRGFPCLVNLIPLNPVAGLPHRTPPPGVVAAYRRILERQGIEVATRKRMGDQIAAACGQLRLRRERRDGGKADE